MTDVQEQETDPWAHAGLLKPIFTRTQVAKLLNCIPLTVANREDKGIYPEPKRTKSKRRYYTLQDVFHLQYITFKGQINVASIASLLWDMGYNQTNKVLPCLQDEINVFKGTIKDNTVQFNDTVIENKN